MTTSRAYNVEKDFKRVSEFLQKNFSKEDNATNWFVARWEYMHYHPYFHRDELKKTYDKMRIWEDNGEIVAVAHYELWLRDCFIELDPDYNHLKQEIVQYAIDNMVGKHEDKKVLAVFVNEHDDELKQILKNKGFTHDENDAEYMSSLDVNQDLDYEVEEGITIQSLADDDDLHKLDRVLHRGFGHSGEPDGDISDRELMQSAPSLRKDLNIVAVAPNGNFASYAGLWFDEVNKVGYVEPVATDPDYRRMGLGKACIYEGIKRCKDLGATQVNVVSNQPFYLNIGFEVQYKIEIWLKFFE